jgi:hypothetical protein
LQVKPGESFGILPSQKIVLWNNYNCDKVCKESDRIESGKDEEYVRMIAQFPTSTEKRVISFGVYGSDSKYTQGAIRNAQLAARYFPGYFKNNRMALIKQYFTDFKIKKLHLICLLLNFMNEIFLICDLIS